MKLNEFEVPIEFDVKKEVREPTLGERLEGCETLADIFELVKEVVRKRRGWERAGLMLGLADLGSAPGSMLGGYYTVGTNMIVMNKAPLARVRQTMPKLYKPYAFYVLMHEYLHSLGILAEDATRRVALEIAEESFGGRHLVSRIAADLGRFVPFLSWPDIAWRPENVKIELVEGFDRGSVSYIR